MRILVVEDDDRIADFLVRALKSEGYTCVRTGDGREAAELGIHADFDLILLDLMLPGLSGLDVCRELRMREVSTPIVMLTALGDVNDVVTGLKAGADDYMIKPFAIDELFARVEAIGRRGVRCDDTAFRLTVGNVVLDRKAKQVFIEYQPVIMTAKEYAVLELLMSHPDRLFSRERILSNVWGLDIDPLTNVVDVYVGKLRKKLSLAQGDVVIETVRGMGFRIKEAGQVTGCPH